MKTHLMTTSNSLLLGMAAAACLLFAGGPAQHVVRGQVEADVEARLAEMMRQLMLSGSVEGALPGMMRELARELDRVEAREPQDRMALWLGRNLLNAAGGAADDEPYTWLGAAVVPSPADLNAQRGIEPGMGLRVTALAEGSPAEKAGLRPGDVLLKFKDQELFAENQLTALVRREEAGGKVELQIARDTGVETVEVELAAREAPQAPRPANLAAATLAEVLRNMDLQVEMNVDGQGIHAPPNPDALRAMPNIGVDRQWSREGARSMNITRRSTPGGGESVNISVRDGSGSYTLTESDGLGVFTAVSPTGEPMFSGPVNTEEQLAALSPELRAKLAEVRGLLQNRDVAGAFGGVPRIRRPPAGPEELPSLPDRESVVDGDTPPAAATGPGGMLAPGLKIAPLDDELRSRFDLPGDAGGIVVTQVDPASLAERQDVRPGDLLVEVNRKAVTAVDDALREKGLTTGSSMLLRVQRGDELRYVALLIE